MRAQTIISRIQKNCTTRRGRLRTIYRRPLDFIKSDKDVIYPRYWGYNSGRWHLIDYSERYISFLRNIGIDFEEGNDAPKGGQSGYYIRITPKGRKQLRDYRREEEQKKNRKIMKQTINRNEFLSYTLTINTSCRSQWERGVEFYAHFLVNNLDDNYLPENIEIDNLYSILLNGASGWHEFAWGGCGQVYNTDIANTLLTPSQRKRITQADTINGYHLLDLEARALGQAANRVIIWAKRFVLL